MKTIILFLSLIFLSKSPAFSQTIHYFSLTMSHSKTICLGDTITLTIQHATGPNSGSYGLIFENRDDIFNWRKCSFECNARSLVDPVVTGNGILSKQVFRSGCDTSGGPGNYMIIKVKPSQSGKYYFSWQVNMWHDSAGPCFGQPLRPYLHIYKYNDSLKVNVVTPNTPVFAKQNDTVNTPANSPLTITVSYPFQTTAARKIEWHKIACDTDALVRTDIIGTIATTASYNLNSTASGKVLMKARAIDYGCFSNFAEDLILFKPCGTVTDGCNLSQIKYIDSNSCADNVKSRMDYHFYRREHTVCENNCPSLDSFWTEYKAHLYNQIVTQTDEFLFLGRALPSAPNLILSKLFFPEGDISGPITNSCNLIKLPRPYSFAISLGRFTGLAPLVNTKYAYFDPVFVRVIDASKTVINYTSPGHIFYPGKVTRTVIKECGKIKIITIGEGTTSAGDNWLGWVFKVFNKFWGESMFDNVDARIKSRWENGNTTPPSLVNPVLNTNLAIKNKNWQVKDFKIKYKNDDSLYTVFDKTDTVNFWNMRNNNIFFSGTGNYRSRDVLNGSSFGTWGYDTISKRFFVDTISAEFISLNDSQFILKGSMPVFYDTTLGTASYQMKMVENRSSPVITSFTPTSAGHGTAVTITGANFASTIAVSFGGIAAASFTVVSDTLINAFVSTGTSGSVSVTTSGGTATKPGFTFIPAPTITSFTPTIGIHGRVIAISGTNFTGTTSIRFGGVAAASFSVASATSISAIVSTGASGSVSVTTPGGTATKAGFTFTTPPTITSFTPATGAQRTVITLTGTNFTGATAVSFGGVAATSFTIVSATTINATVGTGASGNVSVTTPGGTAIRAGFTFTPAPTITSFTPTAGIQGMMITITGTNFTGATAVSFGGVAAVSFTIVSATTIRATMGTGATGSISVTTLGGIATRAGFTFTSSPTINSFTPATGAQATVINITGTNFTGATAVSFGGVAATSFTVVSATNINATVAAGASGSVAVTTPGGTATRVGFTFTPPPTITSFAPLLRGILVKR